MYGHEGDDWLIGGVGNDVGYGGSGNDWLFGQEGYDILYGEAGNDYLAGGIDGIADYLNGGLGADRFEDEWAWVWSGWFWTWQNRDNPADFNAAQGDTFV